MQRAPAHPIFCPFLGSHGAYHAAISFIFYTQAIASLLLRKSELHVGEGCVWLFTKVTLRKRYPKMNTELEITKRPKAQLVFF